MNTTEEVTYICTYCEDEIPDGDVVQCPDGDFLMTPHCWDCWTDCDGCRADAAKDR